MSVEDLKKIINENIIIGTDRVIKGLKNNKIKKVFLASNCKKQTKEDILHYAKLGKIQVVELNIPNEEVGIVCKKPFSISVIGY
ncbi:MAG: ribosomal L7Ae/L30e/S12e/Gadd45 family protein [Candidatus Woesearchaeota archaeon]|nr:MAG: ribosomal L7Ae/L30e/S12e/Gadd45 family protein [Candidatus Woesearchaeota archaeon]